MTQTILITGASSGIGKTTAKLFASRGWNVVASMRSPEKEEELSALDNVLVTLLDVTDSASIQAGVSAGIEHFGKLDVLLNNAGYGTCGPLEAFPMERVRRQFDTNVIGLIEVTKVVLPYLRAQGFGTIINVSSMGGQITFPLSSLYHGTKFAVEGLSESLHFELEAAGIRVKIIEPGMTSTDFSGRSFDVVNDEQMTQYQPVARALLESFASMPPPSDPGIVAEVIWSAVNDPSDTLRYRAGADAEALLTSRKIANDATFIGWLKAQFGLNKL